MRLRPVTPHRSTADELIGVVLDDGPRHYVVVSPNLDHITNRRFDTCVTSRGKPCTDSSRAHPDRDAVGTSSIGNARGVMTVRLPQGISDEHGLDAYEHLCANSDVDRPAPQRHPEQSRVTIANASPNPTPPW